MKTYYTFKVPRFAFGVLDRDFMLSQEVWWDYPERGMYTSYCKSIEDPRFPVLKSKVRATIHIMALVCRPLKDSEGNDQTECMLVTNVDINGLVPKWMVNLGARSTPIQWFNDVERACNMFKEGKFYVKPEHITDWRYGEVK